MSNTRTAKPGSPLRQERYASSQEFERGLLANLVGLRCAVLDRAEDRELVWFLQYLSHQNGGLKALAGDLVKEGRVGTSSMLKFGKRAGQRYNAEQVRAVRSEFPLTERSAFMLKGESHMSNLLTEAEHKNPSEEHLEFMAQTYDCPEDMLPATSTCYPADQFLSICQRCCESSLEADLGRLCLDPEVELSGGWPWYFSDLAACLRERKAAWTGSHQAAVVTEIGRQVYEELDYALETKCLVLIEGVARIGKTFAAQKWCEERPWRARYVQVPSTNALLLQREKHCH